MTAVAPEPDTPGAARDPASLAAHRRVALDSVDARAEDWLLYGEALRALGFESRAAAAWRRGSTRFPDNPALLAALEPPVPAMCEPRRIDADGFHIHLSARHARLDETDREGMARCIGTSDYSYGFAMRGFLRGLADMGVPHSILRHPERIADIRTQSPAGCNIHIGFYPPEHLRLLKGAYNVACFAWEFDRLRHPSEAPSSHAFADQATMLDLADELWMPSAHGAAAVAPSVSTRIRIVPAPVVADPAGGRRAGRPPPTRIAALAGRLAAIPWQPLAILPRAQERMDRTAALHRRGLSQIVQSIGESAPPILFVTVLNVHDYRKQLRPMLHAFTLLRTAHPGAVLLVKASTPHRDLHPIATFLLNEQLTEPGVRPRAIVSDRIWVTDAVLTRDEMDHLFDSAAFYLCTSHAEGQNLPLLEAMGRGVVPVSVDHTAMADYIRLDNAIPIRSTRRPFGLRLSRRYGMFGLETNFSATMDVADALHRAIDLPPRDYAVRSAAAAETVRQEYDAARLRNALHEAIAAARDRPGRVGDG